MNRLAMIEDFAQNSTTISISSTRCSMFLYQLPRAPNSYRVAPPKTRVNGSVRGLMPIMPKAERAFLINDLAHPDFKTSVFPDCLRAQGGSDFGQRFNYESLSDIPVTHTGPPVRIPLRLTFEFLFEAGHVIFGVDDLRNPPGQPVNLNQVRENWRIEYILATGHRLCLNALDKGRVEAPDYTDDRH